MYSRRRFVKNMIAGAAGIYATSSLASCGLFDQKIENMGYISGILGKNLNEKDWKSILTQTAEMGYTELETGSYLGESARSFLEFCRSIGLKPFAGGIGMTDDMDELNKSLDKINELEMNYAILYWPWFVGAPFSLDDCKRSVDAMNKAAEVCKQRNLVLCWHNHDNEFFINDEGVVPFDYLMENTTQDLMCELDIYWVKKGGADPIKTLQKYKGRYPILHIKDMAPGEEQDFACPGEGIIDWQSVFAESFAQDIKHFSVEKDQAVDGLGCLKTAAEMMKNIRI